MAGKVEVTQAMLDAAKDYVDEWVAIGMNTADYSDFELGEIQEGIRALYTGCGLDAPSAVVVADGPVTGAIIAGFVEAWLRSDRARNPKLGALRAACLRSDAVGGVKGAAWRGCSALLQELGELPAKIPTSTKLARDHQLVEEFVSVARSITDARDFSCEWPWYGCQIEHGRHVVKLDLDYSKWDLYLRLAKTGVRYMLPAFCVVSRRASKIAIDPQRRLHCATGPAKLWRDGHAVYAWHGTYVPPEWIEKPGDIDAEVILKHPNAELRRCACEIIGWERVAQVVPSRVIDADPDPEIGTLLEVDLPGSERQKMLRVKCGTGRTFLLMAPMAARTAREAQCLKHGVQWYAPARRT